jgi:oxygen-dependent protoporphyrinogen oxidase
MNKRVCVIGGGISGLTVAHGLRSSGVDVSLFEKNSVVGGNIKTEVHDGFLIEHGPNSVLTSGFLIDFIHELGLSDQIAGPNPHAKKRFIVRDGRLVPLPSGLIDLVRTKAFSTRALLRVLGEPLTRTKTSPNESVADFFARHFGNEIVDFAVDPFVSGIYAGDASKLSVGHAFPKLVEMEKNFGSVILGSIFSPATPGAKAPKGTPRSITFLRGMQTLPDRLHEYLKDQIVLNTSVRAVTKSGSQQYRVTTDSGEAEYDAVVLCTPAEAAARMIEGLDSTVASALSDVIYAPIAVVFTGFKSEQVAFDPRGFGFLVPGVERKKILGSLWTSSVFENRVPDGKGHHLFTTFIGGSRDGDLVLQTDEELIRLAVDELRPLLRINGEPEFVSLKRWSGAIPQYNLGYGKVIDAVEALQSQHPGVFVCSNFYNGISVGDCVKNGRATAKQILDLLNS